MKLVKQYFLLNSFMKLVPEVVKLDAWGGVEGVEVGVGLAVRGEVVEPFFKI